MARALPCHKSPTQGLGYHCRYWTLSVAAEMTSTCRYTWGNGGGAGKITYVKFFLRITLACIAVCRTRDTDAIPPSFSPRHILLDGRKIPHLTSHGTTPPTNFYRRQQEVNVRILKLAQHVGGNKYEHVLGLALFLKGPSSGISRSIQNGFHSPLNRAPA